MDFGLGTDQRDMTMNPPEPRTVIHLELHTGDLHGAVEFYTRLFGWRPERIQAGAASYLALGMGNGVLKYVARGSAIRLPIMLADIIAADPIANWRRVNMIIFLVVSSAT